MVTYSDARNFMHTIPDDWPLCYPRKQPPVSDLLRGGVSNPCPRPGDHAEVKSMPPQTQSAKLHF